MRSRHSDESSETRTKSSPTGLRNRRHRASEGPALGLDRLLYPLHRWVGTAIHDEPPFRTFAPWANPSITSHKHDAPAGGSGTPPSKTSEGHFRSYSRTSKVRAALSPMTSCWARLQRLAVMLHHRSPVVRWDAC